MNISIQEQLIIKKSSILKKTGGNVVVFLREEIEGKYHGIII